MNINTTVGSATFTPAAVGEAISAALVNRDAPRSKSLSDVQVKDDALGTFSAVFSVFDVVDSDGDVVRKGSFTEGANVVVSSYGHTSWNGDLPIGKGKIRETKNEGVIDGRFFLETTHGRDAWATVKELAADGLQEWSYSLENVTAERGEVDGEDVRIITKIDVKEVSPVLRGANALTRTLSVKASDLTFSDHREQVLTALDDLTKRAMEVVTLRKAQDKPHPSVDELLAELDARVKGFRDRLTEAAAPPITDDDITAEYLRFVAFSQGVTTP